MKISSYLLFLLMGHQQPQPPMHIQSAPVSLMDCTNINNDQCFGKNRYKNKHYQYSFFLIIIKTLKITIYIYFILLNNSHSLFYIHPVEQFAMNFLFFWSKMVKLNTYKLLRVQRIKGIEEIVLYLQFLKCLANISC